MPLSMFKEKSIFKMRSSCFLAVLLLPVAVIIIGLAVSEVWADDPECWWNIEFNATDGDVGVRGFFDYEPWEELEVVDPRGRSIAETEGEKSMAKQGFAEWFFESGEPTLIEVPFRKFLRRFPQGDYLFEAEAVNSHEVECYEELTHLLPCAPEIGVEQDGDGVISITWEAVTEVVDTHQTDETVDSAAEEWEEELLACTEDSYLSIMAYEVIVEDEDENIFKIDMPDTARGVTVPSEFTAAGGCFQYEVLAIEASGNQTITEEEFYLDGTDFSDECPED